MQRKIRYFEMQHERNPRSRHFIPLADQQRRSGDLEHAIKVLNEGLAVSPDSLSGRWLLGQCLMESGDPAAAAEQLRRVLQRDPDHAGAAEALARCEATGAEAVETEDAAEIAEPEPDPVEPPEAEAWPEEEADEPIAAESGPEEETLEPDAAAMTTPPEPPPGPVETAVPQSPPEVPRPDLDMADGPPLSDAPAAEDVPSTFVTRTLADIYLAQGHKDKALRILYQVLAAQPDREDILARIAALEARDDPPGAGDAGDGDPDGEDARNRDRFDAWLDDQAGED